MALPNRVLFRAADNSQLWITDRTPAGTHVINAAGSIIPNSFTVITAHPNFAGDDANAIWLDNACAPQCRNGPRLETIRQALARRCQGPGAAPIDQPSGSPAPAMRATA